MKQIVMPLLLALGIASAAQAETLPESLLHCDGRFFNELYARQSQLRQVAPMVTDNQHHAWFVPPKNNPGTVWFTQSVAVGALSVIGYTVQTNDLDEMGKYYFWGFVFSNTPESVMAALPAGNWQHTGDIFVSNPLIKNPGNEDWQRNNTAVSGIAPAKGSAEKLAMLSAEGGKTSLLCSLQGGVTQATLASLRPDLKGVEK